MTVLKEVIARYETDGRTVKCFDIGELIRCKDCKWFAHDMDCFGDCSNEGGAKGFVYTTDYCSRAERKEE